MILKFNLETEKETKFMFNRMNTKENKLTLNKLVLYSNTHYTGNKDDFSFFSFLTNKLLNDRIYFQTLNQGNNEFQG